MLDAVDESSLVVIGKILNGIRQVDAGSNAVSRSFSVKLSDRQVSRLGRVARTNPNELADNRQGTP
jgi:hypothetical protein